MSETAEIGNAPPTFDRGTAKFTLEPPDSELKKEDRNLYIDANFCELEDGTNWIMSQAPLDGTEKDKVSTLLEHWMMIDQYNVVAIAQLCKFEENGESACAKYYPEEVGGKMQIGPYKLKTIEKLDVDACFTVDNEHISVLRVEYSFRGKPKTLDILRYFNWPPDLPPPTVTPALEILDFLNSYGKQTILVHCSTGYGRTGVLVGIKKGIEICENRDIPKNSHVDILIGVLVCRDNVLETSQESIYLMMAVMKWLYEKYKEEQFRENYAKLEYMHEKAHRDPSRPLPVVQLEKEEFLARKKAEWEAEEQNDDFFSALAASKI